jgi:hypothetical protein
MRADVRSQPPSRKLLLAWGLLILCGISLGASGLMTEWGAAVPQENLVADYFLALGWAVLIAITIPVWPVIREDKIMLKWGWMAKTFVTLVVMLPYEGHYSLDAFGYFYRSRFADLPVTLSISGLQGDGIPLLLGWIQERFLDSYHALKVSFSAIGLIAVYLCYRAACMLVNRRSGKAFYALILFPSVLFWSSILGKDPIVILGVAVYTYGVVGWRMRMKPRYLLFIILGVGLAAMIRLWLGLILFLPLFVLAARGIRRLPARLIFTTLVVAGFLFTLKQLADGMGIVSAGDLLPATDAIAHQFARDAGGSTREINTAFTSIGLMIGFLPIGIFTVMFRPLPGEVMNVYGICAGLENLVLLVGSVKACRMLMNREVRRYALAEPIMIWASALIFMWAAMYGFVSYQNLGAAVRFRLSILPIFIGMYLYILYCAQWVRHAEKIRALVSKRDSRVEALVPTPVADAAT